MIYQFKITVRDIQPSIWRELQVSSDMAMDELHYIIQTAMLWFAELNYEFRVGEKTIGEPQEGDTQTLDAMEVTIGEVFEKVGDAALYAYGDDQWQLDLTLVKTLEEDPKVEYPHCVGGQRNSPPEGVDGPEGYATFLLAIADEENPDRDQLLEEFNFGDDFEPEHFDAEEINAEFSDPDNWEDEGDDDFEDDGDDE
jgi:hypothetical protein